MRKNLRSKILLCILAGGVLYSPGTDVYAAELSDGSIFGKNDNYNSYRTENDDSFIYDFNGDSSLVISSGEDDAIYINGNEADYKDIIINDKLDIELTKNGGTISGIDIYNNAVGKTIDRSNGGKITVNNINSTGSGTSYGARINGGESNKILLGDSDIEINVQNPSDGAEIYGLQIRNGQNNNITMGNGTIVIESTSQTDWPYSQSLLAGISVNGITNKISTGDVSLNISATGKHYLDVYGLKSWDGGTIDAGIVNINVKAVGNGTNDAYAYGIYSIGNGNVNMKGGSISAKAGEGAQYAVYTDGGNLKVNEVGGTDVIINGNIFDAGGSVYLNLDTEKSVLNGAVQTHPDYSGEITLNLKNNATWNPTADYTSYITNLNMADGIINQNTDRNININHYSGTGDINFKAEDTDNNGVLDFTNTGDVTIGTAEAGSSVNLGVINNTVNTLDIEKTEESLNAIAQKLTYKGSDSNLSGKVTVKEGLITPEASADLMFDGNSQGYVTNITGGDRVTKTMDAMKNLAATAIVAWRQEDSTLSQRLGELRESDGGQGIWVRMSRGEFEYDGEYKNQYNFFQMGYDWAAGNWHYGAAVSHNDGQTTYTHGDGENRSTSLSLYGTWLGDKGHYADIVLKQGRLSNDFDIYTEAGHTSGDYDAWGTSLSGEYGMKVDLDGGWYVTPQAQLTLMRIGGEDYTTNNGIKVNQDSLESAVGRVGFEVGKRISDSGSIYAKASLLHDFAGSADTYLSLNGLTNSYHQDIGDTWCEAGIGFNYKTSENSYVYADVVKTFGGDVETPWQWNAGMRWTF